MHRRYEQLASQFIPKHSQKYLMKKTLINTKFQWLMKYLNNNPQKINGSQLGQPLKSRTKKIHNKLKLPQSKTVSTNKNRQQESQQKCRCTNLLYPTQSATLKRHFKSNTEAEPVETSIFMEKQQLKNKSLLMQRSHSRRIPLFFQKQNPQTVHAFNRKSLSLRKKGVRSKTEAVSDKQNFILTPWALPDEEGNDSGRFY